ncbi:hypothetical protein AA12717_3739 [Gluconacetobacter sacchari DSM 12717]|uniref:Helix-turn-helix domain-containing protein n=2 Tax=Gluconacetobacter sacchari TaxID=92759 RepID=A0A7W4IA11_9PROT|nr:helix-turn-helix domain-containing protein [Gluconacetobacter sacchari]MBB2158975.1 helix-turn-helix domain-containing protein [Gluconacetobacter sacchari]GBQ31365.1 hypothetical protein AA12717_3739 [Gluconacetobacter sacchari DSM 12717]
MIKLTTQFEFRYVAKARRQSLGMSQARLAELSGQTRNWVIAFERGHTSVELGRALAVMSALGIVVGDISTEAAAQEQQGPSRFAITMEKHRKSFLDEEFQ